MSDFLAPRQYQTAYDLGISGNIIIEILVILILWGLAVMNTELLIQWNNFGDSGESQWQFGQVRFPLFHPQRQKTNTK